MTTATLSKVRFERSTSTADFCEHNIYFSSRVPTSEPGQWRRQTVASLCCAGGPLEALDDPDVETVVVCKGSQTAVTTSVYCWLIKEMVEDPGSALIVMDSTQGAREKSEETWQPIWEDSPRLATFLPKNRRRHWTKLFQRINGSPIFWGGANSPGRLAAKPIRRLFLDETDKYPSGFGRKGKHTASRLTSSEAGAAALARQRTKSFRKKGMAKIFEGSTPTDENGEIYQEYLNGDQRQLYVKCHACGKEQIMVWTSFKIDMDLAKTDSAKACARAHYECPHCKTSWTDEDRWSAIEAAVWKPTANPKDPKCRSYKHPSWLSTFVTVGYLAAQWIKAQESQSALQDFINAECAEPFVHVENRIRDSVFATLEGEYAEGEFFAEKMPYADLYKDLEKIVVMGVDAQKGYFVPVVLQGVRGEGCATLFAGEVSSLTALDKIAETYNAQFILIDQRYRTREIQEWAATHPGYIPCLGVSRRWRSLYSVASCDIDEGGRGKKENSGNRIIEVMEFDPDMLKDILAVQLQQGRGASTFLIPKGYAMRRDYVEHMTAELCVNGRWINPKGRPDHMRDGTLLGLLGLIRFGFLGSYNHDDSAKGA